jgi:hypothetical protein
MKARNRGWRRHELERVHLKRMKRWSGLFWYHFKDVNKIKIKSPLWIDLINHDSINKLKSITTDRWGTRHKIKWGKKGRKNWDWSCNKNTRHKQKAMTIKELREYGY